MPTFKVCPEENMNYQGRYSVIKSVYIVTKIVTENLKIVQDFSDSVTVRGGMRKLENYCEGKTDKFC